MSEISMINNVVLWERRLELEKENQQIRKPFADFEIEPQERASIIGKMPKLKTEPKPEFNFFAQDCCRETQSSFPF